MRRKTGWIGLASLLWLLTGGVVAFGQSGSSTILGTLTDPVDAVLAGANVTVTDQATGATHTASSNEAGLFRLLNLVPGRYALRVEVAGFKALDIKDIGLASSENHDLGKLVLQLGAVNEEVAVTAQATPVQTASSERSELIDNNQLKEVALKGRDAFGFMRLVSGVIDTNADRSLAGPGSMANLYINGMDSRMKNVTFDGVTEIDQGASSQTFVVPNMDAIGEMKILTSAYQAEYGRTAGGGVNMVTKSGTKDFHGTAFWNRRHEDMNANSFFNNRQGIVRPIYRYFHRRVHSWGSDFHSPAFQFPEAQALLFRVAGVHQGSPAYDYVDRQPAHGRGAERRFFQLSERGGQADPDHRSDHGDAVLAQRHP
jgi:Carboxypeptidase regulatory-like domain/TonB-dependent Receptor Plug Domain